MREVNEAVAGVYPAGVHTRWRRGGLRPLLKDAPLSRSAVSRVVGALKADLLAWQKRPLAGLDAIALKVRSGGKVVSLPVLAALAVLVDGSKRDRPGATSRSTMSARVENSFARSPA